MSKTKTGGKAPASHASKHETQVDVQDYRLRAIPAPASTVDTDEYQLMSINSQSRAFAEPLVDPSVYGVAGWPFFARARPGDAPAYRAFEAALPAIYVRQTVARKLARVNRLLRAYNAEFLVMDGFRPIAVQRQLWGWFLDEARRVLNKPTDDECQRFALRFCSNPAGFNVDDPNTWPTHSTGGAVDLTLRSTVTREPLNMGGIYLDPSAVSHTRFYEESGQGSAESRLEAQRNRRLLFWAMHDSGFVNYSFEWWHFDYWTQAWVMNQGRPPGLQARYGLANRGEAPSRP